MEIILDKKLAGKFLRSVVDSYYQTEKDFRRCDDEEWGYYSKAMREQEDYIFEAVELVKSGKPLVCDEDFAKWLNEPNWLDEGPYAVSYEEAMASAERIMHDLLNPRWGESRFKNRAI